MTTKPEDALVEQLRDVGRKGWTARGQPCAGDLMEQAADAITTLLEENAALKRQLSAKNKQ